MSNDGLKREIQRQLARSVFAGFVKYTFPNYHMGWFHKEVCFALDQFLEDVRQKKAPRLILSAPPRHGKTELVSRRFPAYVLGRYPDTNIISTSYAAEVAIPNGRDVRRIIDSPEFAELFPNVRTATAKDKDSVRQDNTFDIPGYRGRGIFAGVNGAITGKGGQILMIDDPLKNRKEADSPTLRRNVMDWYRSTFYTRLEDQGGILVIMTRWHEADLVGNLIREMNEGGEQWKILNFEAIATADEKYRKEGEALDPVRYPLDYLEKVKRTLGSREWLSLYQQKPTSDEGNLFERSWFKFYEIHELPRVFDTITISWDMTFKDGSETDFVVGQVWGKSGANMFLLDQVRQRLSFTKTKVEFIKLAGKYPTAYRKLVEDKANGPAIIDSLKSTIPGIIPIEPDGSKYARASAITTFFEAGNVFLPSKSWCPWVSAYVDELAEFPNGAHDDQVDATSQAIRDMTKHGGLNIR